MLAGALEIELFANIARLQKDMNDAKGVVTSGAQAMERAAASAKAALAGIGAGLSVAAFGAMVKGAVDAADSINKLSQRTGIAAENLSQLQYAAKLADVSTETLSTGIKKLNVNIAQGLAGDKEKIALFKQMGITQADLARGTEAVMLKMSDSFAKSADGAGKTALAVGALGKAGDEMIPLLNGGSAAIQEMMKEADKLGLTISTDFARQAEEFNDNLTRLQTGAQALGVSLGSELVKALSTVAQVLAETKVESDNVHTSFAAMFGGAVKTVIEAVAVSAANVWYVIKSIGIEIGGLAAQAAAVLRGDFSGAGAIGKAMKEEAAAARIEVDRFSNSLMGIKEETFKTAGEFSRLDRAVKNVKGTLSAPSKSVVDEMAKERRKIEEERMKWGRADAMRQGDAVTDAIEAETRATKEATKAIEDFFKARGNQYEADQKVIDSANEILTKIQDETAGLRMSNVERETAIALRELEASKIEKTSEAYRRLKEAIPEAVAAREAAREHKKVWESIDETAHDVFVNIFDGGSNAFKKLGQTLKSAVLDLLYQMTVKKWILNFAASGTGQGISSLIGGGDSAGGLGNLLSLGSNGGGIFSVGSQVLSGSMSVANGAGTLYANAAGTGLDGLLATNGAYGTAGAGSAAGGLGGMGAMAGAAAAMAIIVKGFVEMYNNTKGEVRGGGQYGWNSATGGADFLEGPSGGDPNADLSKGVISTTAASISAGLKAIGSNLTLSAFKGAWEQSINGRGGVFSGGSLSNGVGFGESGAGTNYQWSNPFNSKYEMWGAEDGQTDQYGSGGGSQYRGLIGNFDMSGDPAELATDAQQAMIGAIQAAFNLVPKIVTEKFSLSAFTQFGEINTEVGEGTGTRWLRMYDEAVKAELRVTMPKRLQELGLIDIDPELLSKEDTQKLTEKLTALFQNVNGFRTIVEALPIERLRQAGFDVAASLVEMAGGLEKFAANLSSYVDNFYTQEEKRIQVAKNLQKQVAAVGLNFSVEEILGGSRAKFRELVEMFEGATDEAGMKTYTVLLSIAGAFASITPEAEAAAAASNDYSDSLREQVSLLEDSISKWEDFADSLKRFLRELNMGQLAQNSPYEQYMRTSAEFNRLASMDPKSEERMAGLEEAGRAFLEASNAYNATNSTYFMDLAKVKGAVEASELAARAQVDVARLQLNALLAIQANTSAGGSTTVAGAGGSSGGAVFGGGATAAPAATLPAGSVLTSTGVPFDLAAWSMQNLHDPAGIAAMAQRYGKTQQWFADVSNQSLESVRLWFSNQGIPAFEQGTNYVDRTGLAWLHAGEAVVPKAYNPAVGGGDWSGIESRLDALGQKVERLITVSASGASQSRDALYEIADNTAALSDDAKLGAAMAIPS